MYITGKYIDSKLFMNGYVRYILYLYIIGGLFLFKSCDFFAVGSYPFAEYYTFRTYSKKSLIKRINIFKESNPEYIRTNSNGEKDDSWDEETDSGYIVYFYFPDKNITILCVIKEGAGNPLRMGFASYSTGTNGGDWKRINKDIKKKENEELKKKFETEILNQIGGWSRK